MARVAHKQGCSPKSQQSIPFICKKCCQEFPDLNSLTCHQQSDHALHKPHHCHHCGQKFVLASTLQLHRCLTNHSVCKLCKGMTQQCASCPSCLAEASGPHCPEEQSHHFNHRLHHDSSPYACAPCGRAFSNKQELLCHQQGGECQPAPLSPKAFVSPPVVLSLSPDDAHMSSYASLPPSQLETHDLSFVCSNCHRMFRTVQGLASHQRLVHTSSRTKVNEATKPDQKCEGTLFPCRSCDKVFSQTSTLYLHRKEHRRDTLRMRQQKSCAKSTRHRQKGETYPCMHCGKVFLHHLTRWAHFRSYSSHYQTHLAKSGKSSQTHKAAKKLKTGKSLKIKPTSKPSKESKLIKTNKSEEEVKKQNQLLVEDKDDTETQDENLEYPCASCEEVFSTQSSLRKHEEVHQSAHISNHCSVCTGGIDLPVVTESSVNRVYHCVPCKEAFVDLDPFLQHCTTHFHNGGDNEKNTDELGGD